MSDIKLTKRDLRNNRHKLDDIDTRAELIAGAEILDDTPIALPIGYVPPPTLQQQLAMFGHSAMRYQEYHDGTHEDDFEEDDVEPLSVHQEEFHTGKLYLSKQEEEKALKKASKADKDAKDLSAVPPKELTEDKSDDAPAS